MKILVIRLSSMGDVILTLPAIKILKREYPRSEIIFLTTSLCANLMALQEEISFVYVYDKEKSRVINGNFYEEHFDLIVDLQNNRRSRQLVHLFRNCEVRRFYKKRFKRTLFLLFKINLFHEITNITEEYCNAALGGKLMSKKIPGVLLSKFENQRKKNAIAIFPFAAWENKMWPIENYKYVAAYFADKNFSILIFGGPQDKIFAERFAEEIGPLARSFAGIVPLEKTAELISECKIAIGNDSGLSHLARACNVKIAMAFGSTVREFGFFPTGEPAFRILESKELCRPCHPHGGNRCKRKERYCLKNITPLDAVNALEGLLNSHSS